MKHSTQLGIGALLGMAAFLAACSQEKPQPVSQTGSAVPSEQLLGPQPGDFDEGPTPAERRAAWMQRGVEARETTVANSPTSGSGNEGSSHLK